jgi:hypothetical protein
VLAALAPAMWTEDDDANAVKRMTRVAVAGVCLQLLQLLNEGLTWSSSSMAMFDETHMASLFVQQTNIDRKSETRDGQSNRLTLGGEG